MISNEKQLKETLDLTNYIEGGIFIVIYALKLFFEKFQTLPVAGSLPDMTSESKFYIDIKRLFEKKAEQDRKEVSSICETLVKSMKLEQETEYLKVLGNPNYNIIEIICKNWSQLTLFKYSKFETNFPIITDDLMCIFDDCHKKNLIWYFLTKVSEEYFEYYHQQYPVYSSDGEENLKTKERLIDFVKLYFKGCDWEKLSMITLDEIIENYVDEFIRNCRLRIPTSISILGSLASQEIIKQLTYFFRSINNTVIFNGINVSTSVFEMSEYEEDIFKMPEIKK